MLTELGGLTAAKVPNDGEEPVDDGVLGPIQGAARKERLRQVTEHRAQGGGIGDVAQKGSVLVEFGCEGQRAARPLVGEGRALRGRELLQMLVILWSERHRGGA